MEQFGSHWMEQQTFLETPESQVTFYVVPTLPSTSPAFPAMKVEKIISFLVVAPCCQFVSPRVFTLEQ